MRPLVRYVVTLFLIILCSLSLLPVSHVFASTAPGTHPTQERLFIISKFSTDTTIGVSDTTYDGHDIVVDGATVTINGSHNFNSVVVKNGGTLTHAPATIDTSFHLDLTIAGNLTVESGSSINVSGKGYLQGHTIGNTTTGGAAGYAGGSYGGMGGYNGTNSPNLVYGNYRNPNDLGSGGGDAPGGGLVRITADTATIDGSLLANGTGVYYGSGSGGGIWLSVNTLNGMGTIAANGGNSTSGYASGGGGRIAVHYTTLGSHYQNDPSTITAYGGSSGTKGAPGTVYLQEQGQMGTLRIAGRPGVDNGSWTPLGLPGAAQAEFNDTVIVTGTNVVVIPEHEMPVLAHTMHVRGGAKLTHHPTTTSEEYSLHLTITDTLTVDSNSTIDVSGQGYLATYTIGLTTTGGAAGYAGGSYGGMGGYNGTNSPNLVYGNYRNPNDLGSGGGDAPGGGLVRITADTATINGSLLANGTGVYYGSGSGGGIWLSVNTLNGTGTIAANGGNSTSGYASGGGGRIAVHYTTLGSHYQNDPSTITAYGGSSGTKGAPGTVYLQQQGQMMGTLRIAGRPGENNGSWTPLGLPGAAQAEFNDTVIVTGTNVVVIPEHEMPVLAHTMHVRGGAKLTHHPTTTSEEYSLHLTITDTLTVDDNSTIDVSGRGYLATYTIGLTTTGGAAGYAGGSYGGMGGYDGGNSPNLVYGDYRNPNDLGSGGGDAPGGGLVRITADTATIDGSLLANGTGVYYGSGSGGGIWLSVNTLNGTGTIAANGGNSTSGYASGGGGRIAVHYTTTLAAHYQDDPSTITAYGGSSGTKGAPGTVYLQQQGQMMGTLRIAGRPGENNGSWTPLGLPGAAQAEFNDTVIVTGTNVVVISEHEMPVLAHTMHVRGGAKLTHHPTTTSEEYSLHLTITDTLTVDDNSTIDVSGRGYLATYTIGLTTTGGAAGYAGGSYGGMGGYDGGNSPNLVYGNYRNPNDLGSGGGDAPGGGLVRITADTATIDGSLLANGTGVYYGSGSGGGIWLSVNTLNGTGTIAANGGNSTSGYASGGGGRIAVHYTTLGTHYQDDPSTITAYGGSSGTKGAPGTVYLQQQGQMMGTLRIAGRPGENNGSWTPLGLPEAAQAEFNDTVIVTGTNVVVIPEHEMPVLAHTMHVSGGAKLTHHPTTTDQEYALQMTITDTLTVDSNSTIDVSGRGYLADYTIGLTTTGGAAGYAGGSYGGMGGYNGTNSPNLVYGDYRNPNDLGSGGGDAPGGGLVRITADTATIDGSLLANGTGEFHGSGSGGGIWLSVNTLNGMGTIAANGGNSTSGYASGGGGRIAVHYTTLGTHYQNDPSTITAYGGSSGTKGAPGTVYLQQQGQMGTLRIAGNPDGSGSWAPLGLPDDDLVHIADHVIISGTGVVAIPHQEMPVQAYSVDVLNGANLTHHPATETDVFSLRLHITDTMRIGAGAMIDVSGRGYRAGRTIGNTTVGGATGYAGGSYGGHGGDPSNGDPNEPYGSPLNPNDLGSGGGSAPGGGLVRIFADTIIVNGDIKANGTGDYYGSGSGGGILLNTANLNVLGSITASGGSYGSGYASGSGGRIALYAWDSMSFPTQRVTAVGGTGGSPGEDGTVVYPGSEQVPELPIFFWLAPTDELLHDTEPVGWSVLGDDPDRVIADVVAIGELTRYEIAQDVQAGQIFDWDTTTIPDGRYNLHTSFYDKDTLEHIGTLSRPVLVRNEGVTWHTGLLETDTTWTPDTVHIVEGELTISTTLQIDAGTVVKFDHNATIRLLGSSTLNAPGTADQHIVMTSLRDDTAGGDTNMDGPTTQPRPGDWGGIISEVGSTLNLNEYVDLRFLRMTHGGTLAENQMWMGRTMHEINENVIVPNGVTLSIEPGSVIKFGPNMGIEVQPGGTLIANGNLARPIIFTSIKDDRIGGDTNHDGNSTLPNAGDWYTIHTNGGTATFNHTMFHYGGGTSGGNRDSKSGVLSTANNGAITLTNGAIYEGLYEGIIAWGSGNVTIENSIIAGCDRAVNSDGSAVVRIVNSTIDNNRIGIWGHGGGVEILNTIISNSDESGIYEILSSDITLRYSNVWSSRGENYTSMSDPTGTDGNISADPMYKNREQGNYRLNFGSPAIDAADGTVAPDTDMVGAPRYDDPRSPNTGLPTAGDEYADMGAFEFVENADSNIDLVVSDITDNVDQVLVGETVVVSWTVTNQGSEAAVGPWHDRVFLSTDTYSDVVAGDVLVGDGLELGPGENATVEGKVRVPGVPIGEYHWKVRVNARDEVFEGRNRKNNDATSAAPVMVDFPELVINGPALNRQFGHVGQPHWFKFTPSSDMHDVLVDLDLLQDNGISELYIGKGYVPTRQHFDARHDRLGVADTRALVASVTPDTYYVLAYARSLDGVPAPFSIKATSRQGIGLENVFPRVVVNNAPATFRLEGWGLTDSLTYELIEPDNTTTHASTALNVKNSSLAFPTFDITGLPTGVYDVRVSEGGETAQLTDAITVTAEARCEMEIYLSVPEAMRAYRSGTVLVEYKNTGNVEVPNFPMSLSATNGLINEQTTYHFLSNYHNDVPGVVSPGARGLVALTVRSTTRDDIRYMLTAEVCGENLHRHARTEIISSWDPNDITGPAGAGEEHWMLAEQPMPYTIRFENDAEKAEVPAQIVTVSQQLDPDLDLDTFRMVRYGFGDTVVDVPDNLDPFSYQHQIEIDDTLALDVNMELNAETGEVVWTFTSIDPETGVLTEDPFAGFLPPNNEEWCGTDEPQCGEGFISYAIEQKPQPANGTTFSAQARIVFDMNEPIDTNTYINRIDTNAPTSSVSDLPQTTETTDFLVEWSGSDPDGSGIAFHEIFVSEDSGPFTFWISSTNALSATYSGEFGHTYGFYSVATDNVGFRQATPTAAQATTQLVQPAQPEPASMTLDAGATSIGISGDTTVITATVMGDDGKPLAGATVVFSTTLGSVAPAQTTTNADGIATTTLTSGGETGEATVSAQVGTLEDSVVVKILDSEQPEPSSISMEAGATSIGISGDTTVITATVMGDDGNPLAGATVVFSTTLGSVAPAQTTTNADGIATTTLTSGDEAGEATVSAQVGTLEESVVVQIAHQVTVDAEQGGTLSVTDGETGLAMRLVVPDGAVEEPVIIRFRDVETLPTGTPGATYAFADRAFVLEAFRGEQQIPLTFVAGKPATLTVGYNDKEMSETEEESVKIFYQDGGNWSEEGITMTGVDTTQNEATATITHLTTFALFYEQSQTQEQNSIYLPVVLR